MKKVKVTKEENQEIKNEVDSFMLYKGKTPMVRITGNFYRGGFNLSKNKVQAVLDNIDVLKKFAKCDFDIEIMELQEDEILKPGE